LARSEGGKWAVFARHKLVKELLGRDCEIGLQTIHDMRNNEVELLKSVRNCDNEAVSMKNHRSERWKCVLGVG
jgi:hypothetical protein